MKIDKILDNIYSLPYPSKQTIKQSITEVSYPKGHILLKANEVERSI